MSEKTRVKLANAKAYLLQGVRYEAGKVYEMDSAEANELLDKEDEHGRAYFVLARDKDVAAAGAVTTPKSEGKAEGKATKKATKKTLKVGGGKIEGLDEDGDGDKDDDGDKDEVPV